MATFIAIAGTALATFVAFGRQFVVFTVLKAGLWIFHRFRVRRNLLCLGAFILNAVATAINPSSLTSSLLIATCLLITFAFLFDMRLMFPALERVAHVNLSSVNPDQPVALVELNGKSVAYPLERMVMARHLVHDDIGGTPIVVTYCAICRSGIAFKALDAKKRRLTFSVVGVFRRNMLMEDHETGTIWQQATGEAVFGALKGSQLEMVTCTQLPLSNIDNPSSVRLAAVPEGAAFSLFARDLGFLAASENNICF